MSISGKEFKRQLLGDYSKMTNHVINIFVNTLIKDNRKYPKVMVSNPGYRSALLMEFILMSNRLQDRKRTSEKV